MPRPAYQGQVPAGCPLTNRQFEVMSLFARGRTDRQVMAELCLTQSAVKQHAQRAYGALGAAGRGRKAALEVMKAAGWLDAPARSKPVIPDPELTAVQAAYCYCFVRLCSERSSRAAALVTVAFGLLAGAQGFQPRRPRRVSDIDELLLNMARALARPIP